MTTHIVPGRFVFVCCQVGAERALKAELARAHPQLRFAFSRPGFVTFKLQETEVQPLLHTDFALDAVFARAYGLSLGTLKGSVATSAEASSDLVRQLYEALNNYVPMLSSDATKDVLLHVWARDRYAPGCEPKDHLASEWQQQALAPISDSRDLGDGFGVLMNEKPKHGELVFDVVVVEPDQWWLGAHMHHAGHSPHVGGDPGTELPTDAPSRAYLKLEEGIEWSQATLRAGDNAVEIGSAPGGASYAMLQRALNVVGIDPAKMDARVLAAPHFRHLKCAVEAVRPDDLPRKVQWLVLDMNVEPQQALYAVKRLWPAIKSHLLGMFLTIKLNKWSYADQIPVVVEQLKHMGMQHVAARQLASNRQEVFVYGLSAKGLER